MVWLGVAFALDSFGGVDVGLAVVAEWGDETVWVLVVKDAIAFQLNFIAQTINCACVPTCIATLE